MNRFKLLGFFLLALFIFSIYASSGVIYPDLNAYVDDIVTDTAMYPANYFHAYMTPTTNDGSSTSGYEYYAMYIPSVYGVESYMTYIGSQQNIEIQNLPVYPIFMFKALYYKGYIFVPEHTWFTLGIYLKINLTIAFKDLTIEEVNELTEFYDQVIEQISQQHYSQLANIGLYGFYTRAYVLDKAGNVEDWIYNNYNNSGTSVITSHKGLGVYSLDSIKYATTQVGSKYVLLVYMNSFITYHNKIISLKYIKNAYIKLRLFEYVTMYIRNDTTIGSKYISLLVKYRDRLAISGNIFVSIDNLFDKVQGMSILYGGIMSNIYMHGNSVSTAYFGMYFMYTNMFISSELRIYSLFNDLHVIIGYYSILLQEYKYYDTVITKRTNSTFSIHGLVFIVQFISMPPEYENNIPNVVSENEVSIQNTIYANDSILLSTYAINEKAAIIGRATAFIDSADSLYAFLLPDNINLEPGIYTSTYESIDRLLKQFISYSDKAYIINITATPINTLTNYKTSYVFLQKDIQIPPLLLTVYFSASINSIVSYLTVYMHAYTPIIYINDKPLRYEANIVLEHAGKYSFVSNSSYTNDSTVAYLQSTLSCAMQEIQENIYEGNISTGINAYIKITYYFDKQKYTYEDTLHINIFATLKYLSSTNYGFYTTDISVTSTNGTYITERVQDKFIANKQLSIEGATYFIYAKPISMFEYSGLYYKIAGSGILARMHEYTSAIQNMYAYHVTIQTINGSTILDKNITGLLFVYLDNDLLTLEYIDNNLNRHILFSAFINAFIGKVKYAFSTLELKHASDLLTQLMGIKLAMFAKASIMEILTSVLENMLKIVLLIVILYLFYVFAVIVMLPANIAMSLITGKDPIEDINRAKNMLNDLINFLYTMALLAAGILSAFLAIKAIKDVLFMLAEKLIGFFRGAYDKTKHAVTNAYNKLKSLF